MKLLSVSKLMKRLAGRQTRFVNRVEKRTGSLWESRFKISPIDTNNYLLQCCRYVELNPVKAGMVAAAEDYEWSNYPARLGLVTCDWLDEDPCFRGLADSIEARRRRYREYVEQYNEAESDTDFIRNAVERNQLTGGHRFIDEIQQRIGIRVEFRGRGRPRSSEVDK